MAGRWARLVVGLSLLVGSGATLAVAQLPSNNPFEATPKGPALQQVPDVRLLPKAERDGLYLKVGFGDLASFSYAWPDVAPQSASETAARVQRIPSDIRALHDEKVSISGFMLPVSFENGRTNKFLLLRSTSACCFGMPPALNEWIVVDAPRGVAAWQDVMIVVRGRLLVEERWEEDFVIGIYHLLADEVSLP